MNTLDHGHGRQTRHVEGVCAPLPPVEASCAAICPDPALARPLRPESAQWRRRDLHDDVTRGPRPFSSMGIIGHSAAIRKILHEIEQIAPTNASVLIQGEPGTGKELIATAIHYNSLRADAPLVKVSCVALAESLIESELFGHERGAFTGAQRMRRGRFEMAHGGTLFLDEVGDLSIATQLKLLRAVQEREIERVGGQGAIPVDVRLVAATNRDLEKLMQDRKFRQELYYRLKVVTIQVPPLRERPEDIPPLLEFFLGHFCAEHGKAIKGFSLAAKQRLCAYPWPGNVRELRNCVESLVVTARGEEIGIQELPPAMVPDNGSMSITLPMGRPIDEVEKRYILQTLELMHGNKARTAHVLGISKKTLYRRLHEYGIVLDHDHDHDHDGEPHDETEA